MNGTLRGADVDIRFDDLSAEQARRILAARTAPRDVAAAAPLPPVRVLACRIGDGLFGFPLRDVRMVQPIAAATPVPGAPPGLLGILIRRGLLYNLFDPSAALGVERRGDGEGHMLFVRHLRPRLVLRVDYALGIVDLPSDRAGDRSGLTERHVTSDGGMLSLVALPALAEALGLDTRKA